jgi:adenylate cyclase
MPAERLAFGPFRLNAENGTLLRDGELVPIGQKGARILGALLKSPGEALTKAQLTDAAWPGMAVEESNLSVQIASLRKALGPAPDGGDWIVTVPRVGYRLFVAAPATNSPLAQPAWPEPVLPSIAVLPFENMSGDREQEYFVDGIADDIITGLSRIKWLFVIARNSSFIYKGKTVDVRQVGRELGVRYVLEGGVRKAGNRLRINVQLVEAATAANLWADKYDGVVEDVFDLQDSITDRVVGIVEPSVQRSEIERSRRKRPDSLDAYDLYLRAVPYTSSQMPEDARIAAGFLEDALKIDPAYAAAHALLAWCHEWRFMRGGFDAAEREAGISHARATLDSGTDDAAALAIAALVIRLLSKDNETAVSAVARALAFNPSCAMALYMGTLIHALAGHSADALACAERALRLSPFDVMAYQAHMARGTVAMFEQRFDDAAADFTKMVQANAMLSTTHFCLALALASAGRLEEAQSPLRRGLQLEPGFRLRMFLEIGAPQTVKDRFIEGGRLLGLPD